MTPSEIWTLVDVNQIKHINFGCVAIFSSTGLLIALVELRPFTTMSEVKVNQWDELSQFLFCKRRFTEPIATNGALLEEFMFAIGWHKCRTKNEQSGLYGSLGKIENTKYEWRNQGINLSLVGRILGQYLEYVGDNLFQKIQNFYKSLGVWSFDQVNCEADIPANQDALEFASALTFTLNGFKHSPHLDKDALLYSLGWWFQADKWTGQIQRDASKRCTGGKLIFPNVHFWIDLSKCHGLTQVGWSSSTFVHYTEPEQENKSTTLVGMSAQCSSRFPIIQTIAYARAGFQRFTHKLLCLLKLPTIQTTPYASAGSQCLPRKSLHCAGSQKFTRFLAPVQASNNSHANPEACAGSLQFKQFLTLVQASDNPNANAQACVGSNNSKNPLLLYVICTNGQKGESDGKK
ncbi:hypothetical protein O181_057291 [Austropuccinia psidii MF-1]|uniref:Tet-like 2OG-Fe(II) oxygenase domain-containing protein n=1 Tax=Austropuccinia psidii MF-1 TaxID=1389203 RepID=A0A9Q3E825_9BASI|nr:hypothetical protein [Austropuccinia psidii MF-1]